MVPSYLDGFVAALLAMTKKGKLAEALAERFGQAAGASPELEDNAFLEGLAGRRSHRRYAERPVDPTLVGDLCALALCAPSKSDLQQRDIVVVEAPALRAEIDDLFPDSPWIAEAPAFLVFCGNNRRQRQLHDWRGHRFANDHLDALFNASVDAGIALATFVLAAEAVGLGCCPISAVRNHAERVSALLGLPQWVFPVAGLTLGWPAEEGEISPRLPLDVTLHWNRYSEEGLREKIETYDERRRTVQPFATQRYAEDFGRSDTYGWSEDKARQYARPERADFGAFVRRKGFDLS